MNKTSSLSLAHVREALAACSSPRQTETRDAVAAVAAVLRDSPDGAEVLLIRRAHRDGDPWSGHMAFPGGRQEPDDRDALHTAIRETHEEVGLDLERWGKLIGRLGQVPAIARGRRVGLTIVPFVFELCEPQPLVTNEEVEEILWTPLARLKSGELDTTVSYQFEGQALELPAWNVDGRIVWGLTHRMLGLLLETLASAG